MNGLDNETNLKSVALDRPLSEIAEESTELGSLATIMSNRDELLRLF